MKIALFSTSIDKKDGGPSRSVPILAKGLANIGLDISLIVCESNDMNLHILENSNVKLVTIHKNISDLEFTQILNEGCYDLVHCQNLWNPLYHKAARICRKQSIPYIMTPRGCLEPWCLRQKYIKKKLALILYQKKDLQEASCILATSDMEHDNIRKLGIKSPVAVIPNGIDVSEYTKRIDKNIVKKQICFISRIHEKKGLELLIEAWSKVFPIHQDWRIVIAGNGDARYIERLNHLIKDKGLNDSIQIIPPVFGDAKQRLYRESSIFVLPSYSENFGMVIAEAMSCGVPVITTTGTPWNELNDLGLGWCVDLSVDNIANAVSEAIRSGMDSLFEQGQRCSRYIEDKFQFTSVARKNLETYEWVLGKSGKPGFIDIIINQK